MAVCTRRLVVALFAIISFTPMYKFQRARSKTTCPRGIISAREVKFTRTRMQNTSTCIKTSWDEKFEAAVLRTPHCHIMLQTTY